MSSKDSNDKLDQIKINLEQKLAAIEAKKSENSNKKTTKKKNKKEVVPQLKSSQTDNKIIPLKQKLLKDVEKEEQNKKGFLIYFIYLFIFLIFSSIIHFSMDYLGDNENLQKDIMHQRLSEFKNKHISDSIEMANLDNQILDLQSKKMFDSISKAYEDELIAEARKKSISVITKNYDFVDYKKKKEENSLANTGEDVLNDSNGMPIVVDGITDNEKTDDDLPIKSINTVTNIVAADIELINPLNENKGIDIVTSEVEKDEIDTVTSEVEKDEIDTVTSEVEREEIDTVTSEVEREEIDIVTSQVAKEEVDIIPSKVEKIDTSPPTVSVKTKVLIKKTPIYPGCEKNKTEQGLKRCLHSKMYKHIANKFDKSVANNLGLSKGLHQVYVSFLVDLSGYTTVLDVRAENKALEEEAIRAVQSLPKMEPGTRGDKPVNTHYSIPIKFMIYD